MQFGLFTFPTARSEVGLVELAQAAEERGFDSLFLPEHTHIPVSRDTPYPPGGDLPDFYKRLLDPLIGLAAVASGTQRLLLGTAVCLPNERDLITFAKEVSSLDVLSGGRVLLGVGAGWNAEEMANHGVDPARRWAMLRERVLALKEIWTNDVAEFHGEFVDFAPLWQWPKPVQRPHPSVLIGGHGRRSLERVVEYGDGWIPTAGMEPAKMSAALVTLAGLAADSGRSPVPVTVLGPRLDEATLSHYAAIGVDRCVLWGLPEERDAFYATLDTCAQVMRKVT